MGNGNRTSPTLLHREAGQGVAAVIQDISVHETGPPFSALCSTDALRRQLSSDEDSSEDTVDLTLMGGTC